ncbi:Transcriptional coactivator/pterin dehydratase [Penicillium cf. griseofulvum]|uniref:Transcriptional coactivator/pterin dehydratase n=1 Tax=Penicillium cf. griseofulvum TaxID=2972120 RepID=A0A9W9MPM8_9EURO|nr:Transcriptional coactivator/pterin dehydratase [Penicillium cf. griseofulvum]KAJ5437657.1 Transcriptional coactivator/pterin dehydratase [Penicillium cf. griseofulvum]
MNPDQPSFGERRGHRLAPLQTNFSRPAAQKRVQRPRPTDYPSTNGSEGPVPLHGQGQGPMKRQSSKTSLRNLFGHKSSRADPKLEEIIETQPEPETAILWETPMSPSITSPRTIDSNPTITSPTEPSRANLMTSRAKPDPKHANQEQYGWKPPPLFQAYPQSTKHDCLPAPALSADSILRLHATTARSSTDDNPVNPLEHDEAADAARKKREQRQKKHLRTLSGTINKVEWTQKIYVLATTGYILQYAGEGKHDRLPERMLLLGPNSVAFASDAIPGKHWVVQVSHNPTDEHSAIPDPPKPRFSRFGFHKSNTRRFSRNFLLVFDNPDAMIGWLAAVRAEIEKRGGRKFTQEKQSDEDTMPQLRSKSNVRQMVKKDPNRISSLFLQPHTLQSPNKEEDGQVGGAAWPCRRSSYVSINRRSLIESRSGSVSTGRTEATHPTNGSASVGSDNCSSSLTSSNIPTSPPMGAGAFRPDEPLPEELGRIYTGSPPPSSHGKRQSLYMSLPHQPPPITDFTEEPQANHLPPVPEPHIRCISPPAPNFSVPSFSKKFVPRSGPTPVSYASPPSSINGFIHRAETDPNMFDFASPPQSPTFSVASSRYTDSSETRRILRPSTSEDGMTKIVRSAQNTQNFSRTPRTAPPTGPLPDPRASSRPLSLVGRPSVGRKSINLTQIQPVSPPTEPIPRRRVSTMNPDSQAPLSMLRRKSMPGIGLTTGPPSAPPPNCPLPKLPWPVPPTTNTTPPVPSTDTTAPQMLSPWSATSPTQRFYGSEPVRDHVEDRKSGTDSAIIEPASNIPRNPRHSKLIKTPMV